MQGLKLPFAAMIVIVALSNYLVQFPINEWLTWGAFSYPVSFLVTELTVRFHGKRMARRTAYAGFLVGVLLSLYLATPKIALASGTAFLVAQLLDIFLFSKLRQGEIALGVVWWVAPAVSSVLASVCDSAIFWNLAFIGEGLPILTLATGDTLIKILVDLMMLTPFRYAIKWKAA